MTYITNSTDLEGINIIDHEDNGMPTACIADVWFHDETFYVRFDYRDLTYGTCPIPDYTIEAREEQELLSSFKEWLRKNGEAFWRTVYNDETFYQY